MERRKHPKPPSQFRAVLQSWMVHRLHRLPKKSNCFVRGTDLPVPLGARRTVPSCECQAHLQCGRASATVRLIARVQMQLTDEHAGRDFSASFTTRTTRGTLNCEPAPPGASSRPQDPKLRTLRPQGQAREVKGGQAANDATGARQTTAGQTSIQRMRVCWWVHNAMASDL